MKQIRKLDTSAGASSGSVTSRNARDLVGAEVAGGLDDRRVERAQPRQDHQDASTGSEITMCPASTAASDAW